MAEAVKAPLFELLGAGRAAVSGMLSFATVGELLPQGAGPIESGEVASIDLAGLSATDSAGLALLVEWLSVAKMSGRTLRYENIPAQLAHLAELSEVEELLSGTGSA